MKLSSISPNDAVGKRIYYVNHEKQRVYGEVTEVRLSLDEFHVKMDDGRVLVWPVESVSDFFVDA